MLLGRETPSVAGIINPGAEGFQKLFLVRRKLRYQFIRAACAAHPIADFLSTLHHSEAASSMAALKQPTIKVVAIIAEGVPEADAKQLFIGPATVGAFKLEHLRLVTLQERIDNIIQCKLYRPGSVGFVSKSVRGMSNELYNTIARVTDGIYERHSNRRRCVSCSTLSDHVLRFNNIPQPKTWEGPKTPVVAAWVSGLVLDFSSQKVQFGHAVSSVTLDIC
ncbi:ATP-citrate synthase beta chain protein 2 [Cinnamomum micranthum f. kanehirae]|uniref:ATP-citrate synthase beta chain protein 2 n=1 Tax=Cinnamomum micranthum f. kanehirae TaxID=337451 RepID=A0A3S3PPQ3_9MAGN|nr:ATP-citrate synthase beta chain protein 2 [Cinnamomum micranthum f. kanehirae]